MWRLLPKHSDEFDVIGNAEPADQGMVNVLIKAEVFIVRGQAVDSISFDEHDVIDEGTSTCQMINFLVVFLLQNLDILFTVRKET